MFPNAGDGRARHGHLDGRRPAAEAAVDTGVVGVAVGAAARESGWTSPLGTLARTWHGGAKVVAGAGGKFIAQKFKEVPLEERGHYD